MFRLNLLVFILSPLPRSVSGHNWEEPSSFFFIPSHWALTLMRSLWNFSSWTQTVPALSLLLWEMPQSAPPQNVPSKLPRLTREGVMCLKTHNMWEHRILTEAMCVGSLLLAPTSSPRHWPVLLAVKSLLKLVALWQSIKKRIIISARGSVLPGVAFAAGNPKEEGQPRTFSVKGNNWFNFLRFYMRTVPKGTKLHPSQAPPTWFSWIIFFSGQFHSTGIWTCLSTTLSKSLLIFSMYFFFNGFLQ